MKKDIDDIDKAVQTEEREKGAPAEAQRSGFGGERRSGGMSELSPEGKARDMEPATTRTVEMVTLEIRTLHRQAEQVLLGYAIEIGRRLVEVKGMLPHGEWGRYLEAEVEYSQSTANNFMRIFEEYGASQQSLFGPEANSQTLGNLPYSKALALIAVPREEREAFVQEHDVEGMSTRELRAAIQAREEAEAQAKTAEQARVKMEEDMRAANERMAGMNLEAEQAKKEAREAGERAEALRRELEKWKKRPTAPAPEQAGREAAGETEAEKALKDKLSAAEKAQAEAEARAEKLREQQKKAADQAKRFQNEAQAARERTEALEKKLTLASSPAVAEFGVHFQSAQDEINAMLACLDRLRDDGDTAGHDKLIGAMEALAELIRRETPEKCGGAV